MNHVDLALLTETEENMQFVINQWKASNPHVKYSNKRVLVNQYLDGISTSSTINSKANTLVLQRILYGSFGKNSGTVTSKTTL